MSEKIRVLFILPLPPPVHGSSVMSNYIKCFQERIGTIKGDYVNLSTSRHIDEIGKISFKKILRFLLSYFKTFILLITRKYDVCYLAITCYGVGFLKDLPFILLCKLFRKKIIIHQHNKGMSKFQKKTLYKLLLPLAYSNVKVILLSWLLYPDISMFVKREQIYICPNGIPGQNNLMFKIKKNTISQFLFLSNILESKGIFVLLDACSSLKKEGYHFLCHVVGNASKEISFIRLDQEINKREIEDVVVVHGPKYGEQKAMFLEKVDFFVFPTYEDCFPLVLLEAIQYGLPVISTYEGAIPDIIQPNVNGILCQRGNLNELIAALKYLLLHEDVCIKMSKQNIERYLELFTLTIYEKNIYTIIKDVSKSN